MPAPTAQQLERLASIDYTNRFALVAELGDELIAVGRYDRLASGDAAEVAFVVADDQQGRGIGSILLEHLAAVARGVGIRRFVGSTLPQNRKMLRVFFDAGFEVQRTYDQGTVELSFPIAPTDEPQTKQQQDLLAELTRVSAAQEALLQLIALERVASELAFPPLRDTKEIQQQLPEGTIVFYYFVTSRNVHAFALAKDKYAFFTVSQPAPRTPEALLACEALRQMVRVAAEEFRLLGKGRKALYAQKAPAPGARLMEVETAVRAAGAARPARYRRRAAIQAPAQA